MTDRPWLAAYPQGVPADIDPTQYASLVALMDEAATSHPYYWAGFAIIGDGNLGARKCESNLAYFYLVRAADCGRRCSFSEPVALKHGEADRSVKVS